MIDVTQADRGAEVVIDLEKEFWLLLKNAANQSTWIPREYYVNDWVSDCCEFLRSGQASLKAAYSKPPSDAEIEAAKRAFYGAGNIPFGADFAMMAALTASRAYLLKEIEG